MLPRLLMVVALAALAVAAAGGDRADACYGDPASCQVEGSLTVHVPSFDEPGVTPTNTAPPGPADHAWADAADNPLPGDTTMACNMLTGRPGGFSPGSLDEVTFLTALLEYPPESQARGYTGTIDTAELRTVYGGTLVRARIYALRCEPDILYPALTACIRWGVQTPGILHASPRTGVVNARSLFWLAGVLAEDDKLWQLGSLDAGAYTDGKCDSANEGAACIWDDATSPTSEGVWLLDNALTYSDNLGTYTVDCSTIGGILDACPSCATGRAAEDTVIHTFTGDPGAPVDSGARLSRGSINPEFPSTTATDGSFGDTTGNKYIDVDRHGRADLNPDAGVEGSVIITRRLDPKTLGASIHIDIGPWEWQYNASVRDQRAYQPPSATNPTGPGWDVFADFIANTAGINARGDNLSSVAGAALDALICDPTQSSCSPGYAGPAHPYESHGLQRLRVLVGRSLGSTVTPGVGVSQITFNVDDVYDWTERWDHERVDERFEWTVDSSLGGSSDCQQTADGNEAIGSTCNTTLVQTGWRPSLTASLANARYTYESRYSGCYRSYAETGIHGSAPPSSIPYSGTLVSGDPACSCASSPIEEDTGDVSPIVCVDPLDPDTCTGGDPIYELVGYSWSCTGGSVTTHETAYLSAGHCSGPATTIDRPFQAGNQALKTTPPLQRDVANVISGIEPGLGQNSNLLGSECDWRRTGLRWEHRHHAYWSCYADAAQPQPRWDHNWYVPSVGAPNAITSDGTPTPLKPAGGAECRHQHTLVIQPPAPITIPLLPRALPDAAVPYACSIAHSADPSVCPDTCGTQDGDAHGYPVIRREPILARDPTRDPSLNPTGCLPGTPVGDRTTTVTPPPNNPPAFQSGTRTFYIAENSVAPVAVVDQHGNTGRIAATDTDSDPLTYRLVGACHADFYVDTADNGAIRARASAALDYETPPNPVTCTVRVTDSHAAHDTTHITIHIRNVLEGDAPVFTPASYTFSIGEHARPNDAVGTVVATDADPLTFELTRTGTALPSNHFAINPGTGAITVRSAAVLDAATRSTYHLTVTATDPHANPATATVSITVTAETDVVAAPPVYYFDRILSGTTFYYGVDMEAPPGLGSRSYDIARAATDGSGEWVIASIWGPSADKDLYPTWRTSEATELDPHDSDDDGFVGPWLEVRVRVAGTAGAAWSAPHRCEPHPQAPGC